MEKSTLKEGKIYTAFPEGHYQRKIDFDITQKDPGSAIVGAKLDFNPDIQILPTCFSFDAKFEFTSDMFHIQLYLYQRVDFPKPFNIKESLKKDKDVFKRLMMNAIPHAVKIVHQLILNMGFKVEEDLINEQITNCVSSLKEKTVH